MEEMNKEQPQTLESEILIIINSIIQKCSLIQTSNLYSTKVKDDAKRIVLDSLNICADELDEKKLKQLVNKELMSNMKKKMVDNLG